MRDTVWNIEIVLILLPKKNATVMRKGMDLSVSVKTGAMLLTTFYEVAGSDFIVS